MRCKKILAVFLAGFLLFGLFLPFSAAGVDVLCDAAYLIDMTTGTVILQKNESRKMYPTGLTKMVTALVAIEKADLDSVVTIDQDILDLMGDVPSSVTFRAGEEILLYDLLCCMITGSSNEAALAIARYTGGSVDNFIQMMNDKAAELGAVNTRFTNPTGIHDEGQYTTARDMALIAQAAYQNETYMEIADTDYKKTGVVSDLSVTHKLYTDNHLISTLKKSEYYYDQAKGMAYGYTSAGGYCLISAAPTGKNSPAYLVVLMGGKNEKNQPIPTFVDAKNLLTWAIDTYELRTIAKGGEVVAEAKVALGKTADHITVGPQKLFQLILPRAATGDALVKTITLAENIQAPIQKGDVLGTFEVSYDGQVYGTADLVALSDVERSTFLYFMDCLSGFLGKTLIRIIAAIVFLLILFYIFITVSTNIKRQRLIRKNRGRRMNRRF